MLLYNPQIDPVNNPSLGLVGAGFNRLIKAKVNRYIVAASSSTGMTWNDLRIPQLSGWNGEKTAVLENSGEGVIYNQGNIWDLEISGGIPYGGGTTVKPIRTINS